MRELREIKSIAVRLDSVVRRLEKFSFPLVAQPLAGLLTRVLDVREVALVLEDTARILGDVHPVRTAASWLCHEQCLPLRLPREGEDSDRVLPRLGSA